MFVGCARKFIPSKEEGWMRKETWVFVGWTSSKRRVKVGHRYPGWMPLKLHLVLEGLMVPFREVVSIVSLWELHDFIHGAICGYPLRDILRYIQDFRRAKKLLKGARAN